MQHLAKRVRRGSMKHLTFRADGALAALMPPPLASGKGRLKAAIGFAQCRRKSKLYAIVDERCRKQREVREEAPTA